MADCTLRRLAIAALMDTLAIDRLFDRAYAWLFASGGGLSLRSRDRDAKTAANVRHRRMELVVVIDNC